MTSVTDKALPLGLEFFWLNSECNVLHSGFHEQIT
jgi:hypothetical protein